MKLRFKKVISLCLALAVVFSMLVLPGTVASAAEDDFLYTTDENNTYATITGYQGKGGNVEIPAEINNIPVRYIGEYAFMLDENITAVTVPSSVKAIDRYAFFKCKNLASVVFSDGLKYIGTSAFNECDKLSKITIPDTVLYIDDYAFFGDTGLKEITLGKRVGYIGEYAIGMYMETKETGRDFSETQWPFYDKSNAIVSGLKISGYEDTAVSEYVNLVNKDFAKSFDSLGKASVNSIGDLNGDNVINIKDATITQKIAAKIISEDEYDLFVGDVDDDNAITGEDTTALQKYIVGYDVTLGGETYEAPETGSDPDLYTSVPSVKFYDIDDKDAKNPYTVAEIISRNSKDYTSTSKVVLENFEGLDPKVESFVNVKLQGNSSMGYNKKNFTIKLVDDAQESKKNKMKIVDEWGKESKYVLKANYIDHSHARNIVSAKLWGDIVKTRTTAGENLTKLVNGGAIDGFPVKVYINDAYQGIYTFNIPKDDWMMGMESDGPTDTDPDAPNEAILCGEQHYGAAAFQNEFGDGTWEVEYVTDENNQDWIKETFDKFYSFVKNTNDKDAFKAGISEYTDINAWIDYLIFVDVTCAMDNLDKNMLLATFDSGSHWLPSAYDMDTTFGIHWDGSNFYADDEMTTYEDLTKRSPSLMIERLLSFYDEEIKARYAELREGPLSLEHVISRFEDFTDEIPNGLYKLDETGTNPNQKYYTIPQYDCSNVNQIVTFIANRFAATDTVFGYSGK